MVERCGKRGQAAGSSARAVRGARSGREDDSAPAVTWPQDADLPFNGAHSVNAATRWHATLCDALLRPLRPVHLSSKHCAGWHTAALRARRCTALIACSALCSCICTGVQRGTSRKASFPPGISGVFLNRCCRVPPSSWSGTCDLTSWCTSGLGATVSAACLPPPSALQKAARGQEQAKDCGAAGGGLADVAHLVEARHLAHAGATGHRVRRGSQARRVGQPVSGRRVVKKTALGQVRPRPVPCSGTPRMCRTQHLVGGQVCSRRRSQAWNQPGRAGGLAARCVCCLGGRAHQPPRPRLPRRWRPR